MERTIEIDGQSLTVEQVARVAAGEARVELAGPARARMAVTRRVVDGIVARNEVVYGVTTGFGKLSDVAIPPDRLAELQVNLVRSHAAGVGAAAPRARGARDDAAARERARQGLLRRAVRSSSSCSSRC